MDHFPITRICLISNSTKTNRTLQSIQQILNFIKYQANPNPINNIIFNISKMGNRTTPSYPFEYLLPTHKHQLSPVSEELSTRQSNISGID